jgi:TP901 family phage tail tape measure protein
MGAGLRRARGRLQRWGSSTRRLVGGAMKGIAGLAGVAGVEIVAALAASGHAAFKFEESMTRLQIQSGRSAMEMTTFRDRINQVSRTTGVARGDVLAAATSFVSLTGDMETAEKSLETFAKVAVASGASMEDISRTAAALRQNMQVDPADMERVFSIILAGGKAGAIELRELSTLLSSITPSFSKFGKTGAAGMAELGAMLQLTRQGFGSASESVTGLQGMMNAFAKNAKRFESAGVKIFEVRDGQKQLRGLRDIVADLGDSKLARDPTRLAKAFGRIEGMKAFEQLVKVEGALDDLINKTESADDVGRDYAEFQESAAGRLKVAWNQAKQELAEFFTPEMIGQLTDWFKAGVDGAIKLIKTLRDLKDLVFGTQPDVLPADMDITNAGAAPSDIMRRQVNAAEEAHGIGFITDRVREGALIGAGKKGDARFFSRGFGSDHRSLVVNPNERAGSVHWRERESAAGRVGAQRAPSDAFLGGARDRVERRGGVDVRVTVTPSPIFDAQIQQRRDDRARRSVQ